MGAGNSEKPWFHQPLAVLDTETTGLSPQNGDRVVEVAVIAFDDGQVTDRWSQLIDPGSPLPADTVRITGITQADVDGQPSFAAIAPELHKRLQGRILVAYNAGFDRGFLLHEFNRVGMSMPRGSRWLDHKLGTVAKRLGVNLEEAHRAAADAECAGWVLIKLAELLPADFAEVLDLHEKWEAEQEAERAVWKSRQQGRGSKGPVAATSSDLPINTLGPGYAHGDELDPVRYMYLRFVR
jgi:DNA polymerase-3 subunit epsilon